MQTPYTRQYLRALCCAVARSGGDAPIIHGFGEIWYRYPDIRKQLGCPPMRNDIEKETQVTFQSFQRGEILAASLDSNDDTKQITG